MKYSPWAPVVVFYTMLLFWICVIVVFGRFEK